MDVSAVTEEGLNEGLQRDLIVAIGAKKAAPLGVQSTYGGWTEVRKRITKLMREATNKFADDNPS